MINISKDLTLPSDAITQTYGIIGRKGSGKTYAASRLCELFLLQSIPCIVLDPVGTWYGLRLDKSGEKSSKFNLPIIGGHHGDIPLEHKSGEVVANFLLQTGSSAVIDVSHFRKGQRKEFVASFAEQLFHSQKQRRIPFHLFIEEAQVFIPQRAGKGEERMLGAMEDIVRLGRNYGIGTTLISQRPQSVNKEVLNQVEPLIVFQLVGAHERKAIQDWVSYSGIDIKAQLSRLPSLKNGDGFFWSPAWLNKFELIRFSEKITFDTSATPIFGSKSLGVVDLGPAQLENLNDQMKQMVEKADENDPAKLRRKINELERKLNLVGRGVPEYEVNSRIKLAIQEDRKSRNDSTIADTKLSSLISKIHTMTSSDAICIKTPVISHANIRTPVTAIAPVNTSLVEPNGLINGPAQRILDSLAWWESTGINSPYSRIQVSFIAGYKPNSGAFNNPLGKLRGLGFVEYPQGGYVALTDQGRQGANPVEIPATQEELVRKIMARLNGPQCKILTPVLNCYPNEISRDELASESGYTPGSGAFNNPLGNMKSLGLLDYPTQGYVKASSDLFLG